MTTNQKDSIKSAMKFVEWYRQMVITGQIIVSDYAMKKRPLGWGGDYELMKSLQEAELDVTKTP